MPLSKLINSSTKAFFRFLGSDSATDRHPLKAPIGSPHHALTLPEIVGEILLYCVNSTDDYLPPCLSDGIADRPDICREARSPWWWPLLVCRQWYIIGRRLKGETAYWRSDMDRVPEWRGCRTLCLTDDRGWSPSLKDEARWDKLLTHLSGQDMDSGSTGTFNQFKSSLRSLVMEQMYNDRPVMDILHIHSLARQLTSVELNFRRQCLLDCGNLLERLPSLFHLSISNASLKPLPDNWTIEWPSRLKTLRLRAIESHYRNVCLLLIQLCGPQLRTLHLSDLADGTPYLIDAIFLQELSTLSPNICSVTLPWPLVFRLAWLQQAINIFPRARYLRLEDGDVSMTAMLDYALPSIAAPSCPLSLISVFINRTSVPTAMITAHQLFIARLELNTSWESIEQYEPLHQFLCSPAATHLKELVAPELKFPSFYIEHNKRHWTRNITTPAANHSSDHWACHDLEILSLQFAEYGNGSEGDAGKQPMHQATERHVCAFLVLNFPRLRYLALHHPISVSYDFEAASGICFFGRLIYLEHLVLHLAEEIIPGHGDKIGQVREGYLSIRDIDWMRTKSSPKYRATKGMELNLARCRRAAKMGNGNDLFETAKGQDLLWPPGGKHVAEDDALWTALKSIKFINRITLGAEGGAHNLYGVVGQRQILQKVLPQVDIKSVVELIMDKKRTV